MKRKSKLLSLVIVLLTVITSYSSIGYAAITKQLDLSDWKSVLLTNSSDNQPNWVLDSSKTSVTQKINGRPSAFVSNIECNNAIIQGNFSVNSSDDDYIGFVFGYKDIGHYYLFDWKQLDQDVARKGMNVKLINTDNPVYDTELWPSSGSGNKVKSLYHNNIGYKNNIVYNFNLNFTGEGSFNIVIKEGDKVLDNIEINDSRIHQANLDFIIILRIWLNIVVSQWKN